MSLTTGSPQGNVVSMEDLYVEGSPYIYFQDYRATPLWHPDADNYYWGMSGTATYGVQAIGCVRSVNLTEGVTMNDVRCDTVGVKDTIQKRDYVEFDLEIISQFPLEVLRHMLNLSAPTLGTGYETVGIGQIDNTQKYMVYAPKVYSEADNKWLMFHLHKAKFVDAWTINFNYGEAWSVTGLKIRAYFDDTKPAGQEFGVIRRADSTLT